MAKTRRNRSKARKTRKQKKQRGGGKQVFVSVKKYKRNNADEILKNRDGNPIYENITKTFALENTNTPRTLIDKYKNQNNSIQSSNLPMETLNGNPRFRILQHPVRPIIRNPTNWNNKNLIKDTTTYKVMYIQETPEETKAKYAASLELVKSVLAYYAKKCNIPNKNSNTKKGEIPQKSPCAKIIFGSSATGKGEEQKNINQNFKFTKDPKSPIILIDPAFFHPSRGDFFSYLKFDVDEQTFPEKSKVKIFRKPAGRPFEILQDSSAPYINKGISQEEKEEYLQEVNRQAAIGGFDTNSAIEICCVKAYVTFEHGKIEGQRIIGNLVDAAAEYGIDKFGNPTEFPVFSYGDK